MTIKETISSKVEKGKKFVGDHREIFMASGIVTVVTIMGLCTRHWTRKAEIYGSDIVKKWLEDNPADMFTHILKTEQISDCEAFLYDDDYKPLDYTLNDLGKVGKDLISDGGAFHGLGEDLPVTGLLIMGQRNKK